MPSPAPRELELKLRTDSAGLAALGESEILGRLARAPPRAAQLVSTYFDTPDHRLADRGLALRVRRDGRRLVQTLKADQGRDGAAHDRAEWEVEIASARPDLTAFADPAVLELTGLVLPDELVQFFETRIRRRVAIVDWPDARHGPTVIEVALDEGTIEANGRKIPVAEVELELKEGRAAALFALAEELRHVAALAVEPVDKARRGWKLATGAALLARKAGSLDLPREPDVETGLEAILRQGLGQWLGNEEPARAAADPEGVHQLRVALRRLRSALALFEPVLAEAAVDRWNDAFRWILQEMGPARDLDVLATQLLPAVRGRAELADIVKPLEAPTQAAREAMHGRVRALLDGERYADIVLGFSAWIERDGWREEVDVDTLLAQRRPLAQFAVASLARRYRQARKRGRHFGELSPEARHKVRISLKKLRYGTEFFASLFGAKEARAFARTLAALQDELGLLNDVAVSRVVVLDLLGALPPGPERDAATLAGGVVLGWQASLAKDALPAACESWDAFKAVEPFWSGAE